MRINDDPDEEQIRMSKRLKRFRKFASIEYSGEIFMTPQDFLDSLTLDEPRERTFRNVINKNQVKKFIQNTPPLRRGNSKMFSELGDKGIISYAEYLFLVTLLTKSHYAFTIAFMIFDEDDNMQIDKQEFLKQCFVNADFDVDFLSRIVPATREKFERLIHSSSFRHKNMDKDEEEQKLLEAKQSLETTLTVHLFGRSGRDSLTFKQFQNFYQHLQKELIEIEFKEFSRGKDRISAVDFARLVLRYSILHKDERSPYIRRVYERSEYDEEGISLQQFETFSMFLNNLEDFSKAVRLYAIADIPVSQNEFIRAVKCSTGFNLDPQLVNVLFKIFDANGDDKLSYSEFIAVMSDRLSRGFKTPPQNSLFSWDHFRRCVRNEMKGLS
uniref:EF-hand domain-containing protein n=1 Tax=Meloidogyne javanica TaxID=6303 RepID=A0A915MBV9_MELJA